jgi:hypothetical protein
LGTYSKIETFLQKQRGGMTKFATEKTSDSAFYHPSEVTRAGVGSGFVPAFSVNRQS